MKNKKYSMKLLKFTSDIISIVIGWSFHINFNRESRPTKGKNDSAVNYEFSTINSDWRLYRRKWKASHDTEIVSHICKNT